MTHVLQNHIDGKWNTEEFIYRGLKVIVKSRKGHGIKAHCFENGKEVFTLRYSFILPLELVRKMHDKIDKYLNGEWKPAKLKQTS